jgi:hypothetical protein
MPLRNVILPPKTRQKIETALKNLVRPRLVFALSLVLTCPMRLLYTSTTLSSSNRNLPFHDLV